MDTFDASPDFLTSDNRIPQPYMDNPAANIFDSLPVAVYTCDALGYITTFNKAAARLWGRAPVIGRDRWCGSWEIFNSDGDPLSPDRCPMAKVIKGKKLTEGEEIIIKCPDGTQKNILPHPVPTFDASGKLTGAINTLIDVTEQRKHDARQSMLAAIIESSDDAIVSKTLDGIITSWNDSAEKMFGYSPAEAIGQSITLIIPPERLQEEKLIITKVRSNEKVDHFQTERRTKSGDLLSISLSVSPIRDRSGKIIGASKIARNITAQKKAEAALQRYTQNVEALYSIGKAIAEDLDIKRILQKVTDETTRLAEAEYGAFFYNTVDNNGESYMLYTLSGASKEAFEKIGMPRNTDVFKITFNGEGVLRVDDITKDPRYGKNAPHHGMPVGHLPVVSYMAVPVISKTGIVIGGLFFGHPKPGIFKREHETMVMNIASQAAVALDNAKLYEEIKILNARKDEFIGIASHELKTPLTGMSGYLQLLERNLAKDANLAFVKKTKGQLNKLLALVADLLDVSKVQAGKLDLTMETFNLHTLLAETLEVIQLLNKTHELLFTSDSNELLVRADKQRMEQVIINLLNNAIKYSPGAKQVEINLATAGQQVKVTVKDFGIGITAEQQKDIFSRFFRADGLAHHMSGLGLGLYISKEIIERHKGHIGVKSEFGKGSEFYFTIPVNTGAANLQ